ncbi:MULTISPECIES: transposase, partial [Cyanophyceae]|uniref:transposase n=1 Tax=Cyanophyceae TaxID=3028117 RepID=UPI001A7E45FF
NAPYVSITIGLYSLLHTIKLSLFLLFRYVFSILSTEEPKFFMKKLINEWIEEGNQGQDFALRGAKVVIILDNASFHKKLDILKKIEEKMTNIHLEFLPGYSPDYNLIELVWHSAKEYVANRLFTYIEELEYLLHRLLNEGELIIKWERQLKNKGNSINVI